MITEQKCGNSHIQFFDSEAPKEENCIGTVRVKYAEAFREAISRFANRRHTEERA